MTFPKLDSLATLFDAQRKIQELAYGKDPASIVDEQERIQFIKDMELALRMELGEFLEETGWKPWATSNHVHEKAAQGELSDVMLFFINLCLVVNLSPEELVANTLEKMNRNLDRQLAGYDGISGKCVRCKRALDDTAVNCKGLNESGLRYCGELVNNQPFGYF